MSKSFGEDLWRNLQGVRIDRDGTFRAPVRANPHDGVVVGHDAIERSEPDQGPSERRPGPLARLWSRIKKDG
jgi:hypothetical protein